MKRVLFSVLSVCVLVLSTLCSLPSGVFSASAEGESVKYKLIDTSPSYYDSALETYNVQGGEREQYTPFNNATKTYYDGWSIHPTNTNGVINAEYKTLNNGGIDLTGKSLYMWVYFSSVILHDNFEVVLNTATVGTKFTFKLNSTDLANILKKGENVLEEGYSWNLLEFPISATGTYEITSIAIKISSEEESSSIIFSDINIYDAYISNSETNYINALQKQKYLDFEVTYPTQEKFDMMYRGDSITISNNIENLVKYAYKGKYNLLKDAKNTWMIGLIYNDGEPVYYPLGSTIIFAEEGSYIFFYSCKLFNKDIEITHSGINIESFYGLYFKKPTYTDMLVGKSYIIEYDLNPEFIQSGDIKLEYDSEFVDAELLEDGNVKVTIKKKGKTNIVLKANGIREGNTDLKEYSCSARLNMIEEATDNFYIFEICAYVFLGCVGVAFIVFIVKSFVKARKINVK